MADITLSYKGTAIAELNASGTKTIKTAGKYCEDDITLTYVSPGGGGGGGVASVKSGVQFIDYDGTVVEAWPVADVAAKSALPDNPSHAGLTAQGWNWTLADIKSFMSARSDELLTVGQMYITTSGDTEIDIELHDGRLSPYLGIAVDGEVEVDWGDNTSASTVTGSDLTIQVRTNHTYANAGQYTINIHVVSGSFAFHSTSTYPVLNKNESDTDSANYVYANAVLSVRVGDNVSIGNSAFQRCRSLGSIAMCSGLTTIDVNAFNYCSSLESIVIPYGTTDIGISALSHCDSLINVAMPKSVANIGKDAFTGSKALGFVVIPDGVTSTSYTFMDCSALYKAALPDGVTSIGDYTFSTCSNLGSVTIPDSVTSIGAYAFGSCRSLSSITIPEGVTNIGSGAFNNCSALTSITIPDTVTAIGGEAFSYCSGLGEIHFAGEEPPVVAMSTAWKNIPRDCTIYVPRGHLSDYQNATNYPSYALYTYVEE